MEPAVRVAPAPTRPGANECLPRVDHLPRSDEAIVPEQLPGVEPLAAGACINPCLERTGVFGKTLSSFSKNTDYYLYSILKFFLPPIFSGVWIFSSCPYWTFLLWSGSSIPTCTSGADLNFISVT